MGQYTTNTAFRAGIRATVRGILTGFYGQNLRNVTMAEVKRVQVSLRAYPKLGDLRYDAKPGEIQTIPTPSDLMLEEARKVKLGGGDFTEHTAGGDAARLGMGSQFVIEPFQLVSRAKLANMDPNEGTIEVPVPPMSLLPISIGMRHMIQFAYDLTELAVQAGLNPQDVLKSQFMLITLNPRNADEIIGDFVKHKYFGFNADRVLFMIGHVYPGMDIKDGEIVFAQNSDLKQYHHGLMALQETMDGEIFRTVFDGETGEIKKIPLKATEVEEILASQKNKTSVPIEDIGYWSDALDLNSLALALQLGAQGYRMVMEVVGQKPEPQDGGFWAFDPNLNRGVMIESDSGGLVINVNEGGTLARLRELNRNYNLFPEPVDAFRALRQNGLPFLHPVIINGFLYLRPTQGDINFLIPTAFARREGEPAPINNLRYLRDIGRTLLAMQTQDRQYGYAGFARELGVIK